MKRISGIIRNTKESLNRLRVSTLDAISSISINGKTANTLTLSQSEFRNVRIMTPYGISSSALDDMLVQVVVNDGSATIVGTYDQNRPDVKPGEIIIYSKYGSSIRMLADGHILLTSNTGKSATLDEIYDHIHSPHS